MITWGFMRDKVTQGYLICLVGTVLWSTTGVLIRYLTENFNLPPLVLAFWRDSFVALGLGVTLFLVARRRLNPGKGQGRFLALYGLVLAVFNSLWTYSVDLNGAAVSTVLAYSSAAFTALLGWRFLNEKLGLPKITAVTFSLAGCALVSGAFDPAAWKINPLGILVGITSGVLFATYSLMGKTSANRGINPWTAMVYSFGGAAGILLVFNMAAAWITGTALAPTMLWLGKSSTGWGVLFFLAVGPTVGGFGLYTVSLTRLPASVANLIATLEPAMTAGLAFAFLGERMTTPQFIGSGLILAGVVLLRLLEGGGINFYPRKTASETETTT